VFPQAIALASTWNQELIHDVGNAIASEARAYGIGQVDINYYILIP
jgi:beta-glucosidase-like glycosyl hydrolase